MTIFFLWNMTTKLNVFTKPKKKKKKSHHMCEARVIRLVLIKDACDKTSLNKRCIISILKL